jgi:hypothetical protein
MIIFWVCAGLITAMLIIVFVRNWYVEQRLRRLLHVKILQMAQLLDKLQAGTPLSISEVMPFAKNPALRIALRATLVTFNMVHLMPDEFSTQERGAEGYLVNWLEYPTELGEAPDEIALFKVVVLDAHEALKYYVFRFRTKSPRWAEKLGWMLGVCGPYDDQTLPFDQPLRIFSRFNTIEYISPENEVRWVHENINVT